MILESNILTWTAVALAGASVALAAYVFSGWVLQSHKMRSRFGLTDLPAPAGAPHQPRPDPRIYELATMGMDADARRQLRNDLIRCGYFSPRAPHVFLITKTACVILVPLGTLYYVHLALASSNGLVKFLAVAAAFLVSYYLPQAFIDRRRRLLENRYRLVFPDFLDMLVVCVNAGLSLNAALERVTREIGSALPAFRTNLELLLAETRAGKSVPDALKDFASRLGLAEAGSLATLLRQSLELGTDISQALTVFSDEMRDKRISRAEEKAMSLPVKMTLPLAAFILPTVFIVIMTPAGIKIVSALKHLVH